MEAFDVCKDFDYAKKLDSGEVGGLFSGVFYCSNENISNIISEFDFFGKDCLVVTGSGDQPIHAFCKGAASVDVFDISVLAKYYLYLRKWFIKYNNEFYPDKSFPSFEVNSLLEKVDCQSEQELSALIFWKKFMSKNMRFDKLLSFPLTYKENIISDVEKLERFINCKKFNSYLFDLCHKNDDEVFPQKQYDIVYTSNIIEHCGMDKTRIEFAKDNLCRLLKSNGIVICSQLFSDYFDPPRIEQRRIFEESFDYKDIIVDYYADDGSCYDYYAGYVYTKK